MKRLLITLILLFFIQLVKAQELAETYQNWLNQTSLGSFLQVDGYHYNDRKLILKVVDQYHTADQLKMVSATWDSLSKAYRRYQLDIPTMLYLKLSQLEAEASCNLSIDIKSEIPILFSGNIKMENKHINSEFQFLNTKGDNYPAIDTEEGLLFPSDFLLLKTSWESAKKVMLQQVQKFLKKHFKISKNELVVESNGQLQETYTIKRKSLFTGKYHDRIILTITYSATPDRETLVHFEFDASYAAGIITAGKYSKIDIDYLPIVVDIQQKFKSQLYNYE